jgi:hypothetical protein
MKGLGLYSGAMVLLALNACSGQASGDASARASSSASNGAAWVVVEEPKAFRIEFPSAPKKQGGKGLAEGTATLEYSLSQGSSSYSLRESIDPLYAAIKKDDYRGVVEGALKTKLQNYQDNDSGRLLSEKEVPIDGGFGKEIRVAVERPAKGVNLCRIIVAEGRYYVLLAFVPDGDKQADPERFLASFKRTP